MTEIELRNVLARGEDSRHQFKRDVASADSLAAELVALANSGGGKIYIGVADDGSIVGLDLASVQRLNQLISNASTLAINFWSRTAQPPHTAAQTPP